MVVGIANAIWHYCGFVWRDLQSRYRNALLGAT